MFIINKREAIALFSLVITIPLCIIVIAGYVITNTSDNIAESMLIQYCTDKSKIGATDFYIKDIGNYRVVISISDKDPARSNELYIFRSVDRKSKTWSYYGGIPGGTEDHFNIYMTELEINYGVKCMFSIIYSDNIDHIAKIEISSFGVKNSTKVYNVLRSSPFIIADSYTSPAGLCCKIYDINGDEILR